MASGCAQTIFCHRVLGYRAFQALQTNCCHCVAKRTFRTNARCLKTAENLKVASDIPSTATNSTSYGPSVRLLLTLYDIPFASVKATGPHGRLLKGDVLNHININKLDPEPLAVITTEAPLVQAFEVKTPETTASQSVSSPAYDEDAEYHDIELSSMRKTIAKRLTLSKSTIPHVYASTDCSMAKMTIARRQLAQDGSKVSYNDFIIKACAVALQKMPSVNAVWTGDEAAMIADVDISVAVATDKGLITPIVTNANERSLEDISNCVKDLATRARGGTLKPAEFQGGSFTISNLGMFGIKEFSAVINPPQACILAVGGSQVVLGTDGKPETVMTITLSCDERIANDEEAARFTALVKDILENPMSLAV